LIYPSGDSLLKRIDVNNVLLIQELNEEDEGEPVKRVIPETPGKLAGASAFVSRIIWRVQKLDALSANETTKRPILGGQHESALVLPFHKKFPSYIWFDFHTLRNTHEFTAVRRLQPVLLVVSLKLMTPTSEIQLDKIPEYP